LTDKTSFLIRFQRAPGDSIALSALIRDIKLNYPNFQVDVADSSPDVWTNNPHLTKLDGKDPKVAHIDADYRPGLKRALSGSLAYYLFAFHECFQRDTGYPVEPTYPKPELFHWNEPTQSNYWIVVSGCKPDITTKMPDPTIVQEIISRTAKKGTRWLQCGLSADQRWQHKHPTLKHTENLVGRTSLADFFGLVKRASGVLCCVSMPMLVASAFEKPCIVLAGGRESPWWFSYTKDNPALSKAQQDSIKTPHMVHHTIGRLNCCQTRGCGKTQAVQPPGPNLDVTCVDRVLSNNASVPRCHTLYDVDAIVGSITSIG
jgi:ADP-heptose:LPS heptosyltransferase